MRFNQVTEFGEIVFFFLQQWRAGKSKVAGVGKHQPHSGRKGAKLGTVTLIDKDENIG